MIAHTVSTDGRTIRLLGSITEESNFDGVMRILGAEATLDLAGVLRINSSGVRKWLLFLRGIPPEKQISLERCPVAFVAQLNMIAGFGGSAVVRSVFVPLVCTNCGCLSEEVVPVGAHSAKSFATESRCPECAGTVELDADPANYFAFTRVLAQP